MALRDAIRSVVVNALLLRERWSSGAVYNPLSAAVAQDPYPQYADLRERSPVHRSRLMNAWVFTRHADVDTVLRDHRRFSNDPRKRTLSRRQMATLPGPDDYTMLFLDPPDHTRLRALVNKAFTRRAVNALEPHIRGLMNSLLDAVDPPASTSWRRWRTPCRSSSSPRCWGCRPGTASSSGRGRTCAPASSSRRSARRNAPSQRRRGKALDEYFVPIIQARRAEPESDIVSALAQAEEEGDVLTEREMLNMLRLLLVAGQRDHHQPHRQRHARAAPQPGRARAPARGPGPHPRRGGGAAALRLTGADGLPGRARGLRGERGAGAPRREHRPPHRLGQPRPGGVRGARPPRRRPLRGEPHLVRPRHPPLHRGAARAPRRAASSSRSCWSASRRCASSPSAPRTGAGSCSAASSPSPSPPSPPDPFPGTSHDRPGGDRRV